MIMAATLVRSRLTTSLDVTTTIKDVQLLHPMETQGFVWEGRRVQEAKSLDILL